MDAKRIIIPLLFIIVAFSCNKNEEQDSTITINGIVLDSIQNTPLSDVEIQLWKTDLGSSFPTPLF